MKLFANLAAALVGVFSLAMGALAWKSPEQIGEILGLIGPSMLGEHTLRGDIGAIFLASGLGCAAALFLGKTGGLKFPIVLYGLVLLGRLFSLVMSGSGEGVMQPIMIEVGLVALSVFAYKTLKKA